MVRMVKLRTPMVTTLTIAVFARHPLRTTDLKPGPNPKRAKSPQHSRHLTKATRTFTVAVLWEALLRTTSSRLLATQFMVQARNKVQATVLHLISELKVEAQIMASWHLDDTRVTPNCNLTRT